MEDGEEELNGDLIIVRHLGTGAENEKDGKETAKRLEKGIKRRLKIRRDVEWCNGSIRRAQRRQSTKMKRMRTIRKMKSKMRRSLVSRSTK